jgi:hypothetical protein
MAAMGTATVPSRCLISGNNDYGNCKDEDWAKNTSHKSPLIEILARRASVLRFYGSSSVGLHCHPWEYAAFEKSRRREMPTDGKAIPRMNSQLPIEIESHCKEIGLASAEGRRCRRHGMDPIEHDTNPFGPIPIKARGKVVVPAAGDFI